MKKFLALMFCAVVCTSAFCAESGQGNNGMLPSSQQITLATLFGQRAGTVTPVSDRLSMQLVRAVLASARQSLMPRMSMLRIAWTQSQQLDYELSDACNIISGRIGHAQFVLTKLVGNGPVAFANITVPEEKKPLVQSELEARIATYTMLQQDLVALRDNPLNVACRRIICDALLKELEFAAECNKTTNSLLAKVLSSAVKTDDLETHLKNAQEIRATRSLELAKRQEALNTLKQRMTPVSTTTAQPDATPAPTTTLQRGWRYHAIQACATALQALQSTSIQ